MPAALTTDIKFIIHPLAAEPSFFIVLPFAEHGLEWIYPLATLTQPFDVGHSRAL